jgi:heavy metal translocating P-type ATPase
MAGRPIGQRISLKMALPIVLGSITILSWLFVVFLKSSQLSDALSLPVALLGGAIMLYAAVREIIHGNLSIDLLASIAVISAVAIHQFLPAAIVVVMLLGGQAIEEYAAGRSSRAIDALVQMKPETATLLSADKTETVNVQDLKPGHVVVIRPGDRIPVDGEIVSGHAAVDESSITGESMPVEKVFGSRVLTGTICQNGSVLVKAIAVGEDTKFAHIIRLVRQAQTSKAKIQRVADRYAKWFTPVIVGLAVLTYVITWQPIRAVTILLTASPCPLLLATPVAVVSAIGRGARSGILIRSGDSLETAGSVDTVVFDKTGTLTSGKLRVVDVHSFNGYSKADVARNAAIAEQFSTHPIAKAVIEYAQKDNPEIPNPDDFNEDAGGGVMAEFEGNEIFVGNSRFLEKQMIHIPAQVRAVIQDEDNSAATTLLVARNHEVCGTMGLEDSTKPTAFNAIRALKGMGINIAVLTGDTKRAGEKIKRELNLTEVFSEVLPEDKANYVTKLKRSGRRVAMVGDGINDAPALATADVGIAMGAAGSDVAVETADFTIMTDDLERVPSAIKLSRRMLGIAKQSILIGLSANVIGVVLSAFGLISPIEGASIHEVSDLLVIFNSARAFQAA